MRKGLVILSIIGAILVAVSLFLNFKAKSIQDNLIKEYEEKIKIINEAYSILEHNTFYEERKSVREEKERYEKNKQIKKEQILTEIIVKTYYQSQSEINKLRENFLSNLINKVSKLTLNRRSVKLRFI